MAAEAVRLSQGGLDAAIISLGTAELQHRFGFALQPDEDDAREAGQAGWQQRVHSIRLAVCSNEQLRRMRTEKATDLALAAALIDLVTEIVGGPTVVSCVAIILCVGLDKLCAKASG